MKSREWHTERRYDNNAAIKPDIKHDGTSLSLSFSLAEEVDIESRGSHNFNASMPIPAVLSPPVRPLAGSRRATR